ncbi:hypothetical protein TWF173_010967 [Orbilia oligospora]|uniref:Uncharacterized protein n=2 Tax=Orbilia oligospora TaxID=2813651 RepID=G1XNF7_ARTOA|nr:hypothetical protein AOL_s00170g10 [Orbilia oligospora ATCC 24927]EGX45303.1 hypothetical protein AOL_s00170g10 [Orbilia oligospora ATCC 24927]KAF3274326.1 hypothetical protein TWF970_008076 [Orbilia oligospora]KAF3317314.1 hypothetical protein TWF173_010967 [Orbilia oligospora]
MLLSLVSLLALGASSLAHPLLEERTGSSGCNADNVLRLLRATQRVDDSIAFCSQFLDLPASTHTVTPAPTATAYVTVTTEIQTSTVTETFVWTETDVEFEKLRKRCTSTTTTTKSISTPGYILSTSIDPSRLSSACQCLTIPLATITVTDLPGTLTNSVSATETETETKYTVKTETTTITAPSLALASPTAVCCGGNVNAPAHADIDDAYYRIEVPDFEVEVYGVKSHHVFASVNGLIWLDEFSQGNYWYYFTEGDTEGAPLPHGPDDLPDVAILAFWSDLLINGGKVQGIYYQISGDSITLEYVVSAYGNTDNDYHFLVTLSNNNKVTIKYLHVLNSEDGVVAIQKKSDDAVILWSNHGSNVETGLTIEFDTTAGTVNPVVI